MIRIWYINKWRETRNISKHHKYSPTCLVCLAITISFLYVSDNTVMESKLQMMSSPSPLHQSSWKFPLGILTNIWQAQRKTIEFSCRLILHNQKHNEIVYWLQNSIVDWNLGLFYSNVLCVCVWKLTKEMTSVKNQPIFSIFMKITSFFFSLSFASKFALYPLFLFELQVGIRWCSVVA